MGARRHTWIGSDEALAVHDIMLAQHGGMAGVRDRALFECALGRPANLASYGSPDVADLAASYAFGIIQNHPFNDGNKRTGFVLGAMFLELNGYRLAAAEDDVVRCILAVASGKLSERDLAAWFRRESKRRH